VGNIIRPGEKRHRTQGEKKREGENKEAPPKVVEIGGEKREVQPGSFLPRRRGEKGAILRGGRTKEEPTFPKGSTFISRKGTELELMIRLIEKTKGNKPFKKSF